ncbi:MAG: riboflavin synthase [Ferruginibacter sp.]
MFTGIIESMGKVTAISAHGSNKTFWIASPVSDELTTDQSVSHNGVCLTVEETRPGEHRVTAIDETLKKTNLGNWTTGTLVNLERCMPLNGRLDGHIVQGHADCTATCTSVVEKEGSWEYHFSFPENFSNLVIEKGSISLNGTSLTVFNVKPGHFTVAIIPYTFVHTNIGQVQAGDTVNIEFDVVGKYVERIMQNRR